MNLVDGAWKKEKLLLDGESTFLRYGVATTEGWRDSMEDEVVVVPDWRPGEVGFFAVYDGHDGSNVSRFCAKYLHLELRKAVETGGLDDLHGCLKRTFLRMDSLMRTKTGQAELVRLAKLDKLSDDGKEAGVDWDAADLDEIAEFQELALGGSTALVALVFKDRVVVANAGDCRCVLSREGKAVELSRDHKPDVESEKNRITAAGGAVWRGRISGVYNVSRGLGDFVFKAREELPAEEQMISAEPEIQEVEVGNGCEFLVLGSDGIWPLRESSSQDVVSFVSDEKRSFSEIKLSDICLDFIEAYIARVPRSYSYAESETEVVMEVCQKSSSSSSSFGIDNMSIVVVDIGQF